MRVALRLRDKFRCVAASVFFVFLGALQIQAQSVSEYQVKAAYLYNFAKFVEWPAANFAAANSRFEFCVMNNRAFAEQLAQTVKDKTVAGRLVDVVPVRNTDEARSCHILFISSSRTTQAQMIAELRDTSVLTVGETDGFVEEGGMINFVLQDDRIQFQVNQKAASQAGLRVSSRLLSVAKLVIK